MDNQPIKEKSLSTTKLRICPSCEFGILIIRKDEKGKDILRCSAFPRCKYTEDIAS